MTSKERLALLDEEPKDVVTVALDKRNKRREILLYMLRKDIDIAKISHFKYKNNLYLVLFRAPNLLGCQIVFPYEIHEYKEVKLLSSGTL